jgi:cobalamin-dependent methionine synthase I
MKKSMAFIPFIEASKGGDKGEWKNPYGDREGDVHDIGKIL